MENSQVAEATAPSIRRKHKLTEVEALEILNSTETQRAIAKRYGIQQPYVSDIKSGRRWSHLQPGKVYTPKSRVKEVVEVITDDQIRKYDPMIKQMINHHVLRYWAGGNTCSTLDPRASIGRLGKSVEDLIQDGRVFVLQQLRWVQKNLRRGRGMAKESTLVFFHLKRKFISLSRSFASARHGGQVIDVENNRKAIQGLIDSIPSDMPIDESVRAMRDAMGDMNKDLRKSLLTRVTDENGAARIRSSEELTNILRDRLLDTNMTTHVSLDDAGDAACIDLMNPETYAMVAQELAAMGDSEFPLKMGGSSIGHRTGGRVTRFRIFKLAKEKGLPHTHCELATYLGRSASALSNILHNHSQGTPEFRKRLVETFGEPLEELRKIA